MISGTKSLLLEEKTNDGTKYLFIWFRLLGILMPDKYKALYILYSFVVNLFSIVILPLTFTLSYFMGSEKMILSQFFTSIQATMNLYACATKFVIIAYMRRYLFRIEAILEKLDARVIHPDEVLEVRKTIKFGYRVVFCFTIMFFSYSTTTALGAVYGGRPPYSLYIPFMDWRDSKQNFIIVAILEYMLIDIACFQEVANDSYAVIYVGMIHTHLKILIMKVSRIGVDPKISQEDNLKELRLCIQDHKNIIELIDAVAPVISPTVFFQFLVSVATLGITLINITLFGNRSTIIGAIFFIGVIFSEILPICYFINCLMAEGDRLPEAVFHMNWMDQNRAFRQHCLFFMHRSQQSMIFFAGKIFPITLDTFVGIVKFSFSLYTLLSKLDFAARFK